MCFSLLVLKLSERVSSMHKAYILLLSLLLFFLLLKCYIENMICECFVMKSIQRPNARHKSQNVSLVSTVVDFWACAYVISASTTNNHNHENTLASNRLQVKHMYCTNSVRVRAHTIDNTHFHKSPNHSLFIPFCHPLRCM